MTGGLTIERLGHRGDGIAAGPVFVPGALPGEVVAGEVAGGRMAAPRIVTASPHRVRPPCPHARGCGGCQVQHGSDDFVTAWKIATVRQALATHGLTAGFRPIVTSPPRSRRRATLAGRRTRRGAIVGFHARASDAIVAIPNCVLLHPDLMAALPALERITEVAASRRGTLGFTVTRAAAGLDVAVSGADAPGAGQAAEVARIAAASGIARLTWESERLVQCAEPVQRFARVEVLPPPGAFLQATAEGEAALRDAVLEAVGAAGRIADLFAGCGTFALPLTERAAVHAVEGDRAMCSAMIKGWNRTPGLRALSVEARDLFGRPLDARELGYDAVVIDPPRAGAAAQAACLAESAVPRIAALSCNPATFARDARVLVDGGYRLRWVQVVDQFRWSTHVELAALFTKGDTTTEANGERSWD